MSAEASILFAIIAAVALHGVVIYHKLGQIEGKLELLAKMVLDDERHKSA